MPDHNYFANLIWQIADLLRGPYTLPQYERVMLYQGVSRWSPSPARLPQDRRAWPITEPDPFVAHVLILDGTTLILIGARTRQQEGIYAVPNRTED